MGEYRNGKWYEDAAQIASGDYHYEKDYQAKANIAKNKDIEFLRFERSVLFAALYSIANNSCCGDCQEARKVAELALSKIQTLSPDDIV